MGRWPLRGKGAIKESIPPPRHVQASRTTHTLPMARLEAVHWPQGARGGGGGGGGGRQRGRHKAMNWMAATALGVWPHAASE